MTSPPTMTRRNLRLTILTHPFELALGAAQAINGARGLFGDVSPSLEELPAVSLYLYLAVATLGGIGVVVGLILNDPPQHIGLGKTLERSSLYLVAAAYGGLAILLIASNGWAGFPTALVTVVVGAACLARARAIVEAANVILEQLEARNAAEESRDE